MKALLTAALLAFSAAAYAGLAEDALLSAQSACRSVLKAPADNDGKLIALQNALAGEQKRARQTQQDITRL